MQPIPSAVNKSKNMSLDDILFQLSSAETTSTLQPVHQCRRLQHQSIVLPPLPLSIPQLLFHHNPAQFTLLVIQTHSCSQQEGVTDLENHLFG